MQKIRFVNPVGAEINISLSPPYLFEKISGIGAEDAQLITSEPAAIDGQTLQGCYFGSREITVTCHVFGNTRAEMYENRQKLIALLSSEQYRNGATGQLYYTNDYLSVWIPAAVKRGPQNAERYGNYTKSIQLVFTCPGHLFRSVASTDQQLAYLDGGMSFPLEIDTVKGVMFGTRGFEAELTNVGDFPAPISVTITGPSLVPKLEKANTGEYILIKQQLYAGDILRLDTTPGGLAATIQRVGGSIESGFGYLDLGSTFFALDPGLNTIRYSSGDDTMLSAVTVSIYSRFGGV